MSARAEAATEQLEKRNGGCVSGSCKCERFEFKARKDGFPTCVCTHTRWAHANTWVQPRATGIR